MDEDRDLFESENILIERLGKIWREFDFIFGVSSICQGDDASKAMLAYLDSHPTADSSDILEKACEICEIYNPELVVVE